MHNTAPPISKLSGNQFCYMFYATNDIYCHAVITAITQLYRLKKADHIDIVVMHFSVSDQLIHHLQSIGSKTVELEPDLIANHDYFHHAFLKLKAFQFTQYKKILFLDADSLSLKNLDHLFLTDMNHPIYMPAAYWIDDVTPFFTSAVILLQPSAQLYDDMIRYALSCTEANRGFDMDVLNNFFAGRIGQLDSHYCCLNSEWETCGQYNYFGDQNQSQSLIKHVHFSALGKPWQYEPAELHALRPNAHPFFYTLWSTWWDRAKQAQTLLNNI